MDFRIADTFTESLARLTSDEQKAFNSVALGLRMIVHRTHSSLLSSYVAHHDDPHHWRERRKLETHPKTGAAQLVELRETVQEILVPEFVEVAPPRPSPCAHMPEASFREAIPGNIRSKFGSGYHTLKRHTSIRSAILPLLGFTVIAKATQGLPNS